MLATIGELRNVIDDELMGGSCPDEAYDRCLIDDPAFNERSVLVPDEIKSSIKRWMQTMMLDGRYMT